MVKWDAVMNDAHAAGTVRMKLLLTGPSGEEIPCWPILPYVEDQWATWHHAIYIPRHWVKGHYSLDFFINNNSNYDGAIKNVEIYEI